MKLQLMIIVPLLFLSACVSPIVWGSDDDVEHNLKRIVPLGSSISTLRSEALKRDWRIDNRNVVIHGYGVKTYFDDTHLVCRGMGGPVVPSLVAKYWSPFLTSVEVMWVFDRDRRLRDVCVRRTTDSI